MKKPKNQKITLADIIAVFLAVVVFAVLFTFLFGLMLTYFC